MQDKHTKKLKRNIMLYNTKSRKPSGYWTKERCHQEALLYNIKVKFKTESSGAYQKAAQEGFLDEICSHMVNVQRNKPYGYWTKERCHQEALKYIYRKKFKHGSTSAYTRAQKKGFLDEICSHMIPAASIMKRFVYAYEFADKCVYVGLSHNVKKRNNQHLNRKKSAVYKHCLKCKDYKLIYITNEPIDMIEASNLETSTAMKYQEEGWTLLNNISLLGQLGKSSQSKIWTKEKCLDIALQYEYRIDWKTQHASSYQSASFYGWLKDCTKHMKRIRREAGYWTKESCHKEALNYTSRFKFQKGSRGAYAYAFKHGILDEVCSHMEYICAPKEHWTFEKCEALAKECKDRKEFRQKYSKAYFASERFNFIKTLFPKKIFPKKIKLQKDNYIPSRYLTKENCYNESVKYSSRSKFKKGSASAYKVTLKNNWMDEFFPKKIKANEIYYNPI
jgi:predicted GIY-YIG superfamily endonuclease